MSYGLWALISNFAPLKSYGGTPRLTFILSSAVVTIHSSCVGASRFPLSFAGEGGILNGLPAWEWVIMIVKTWCYKTLCTSFHQSNHSLSYVWGWGQMQFYFCLLYPSCLFIVSLFLFIVADCWFNHVLLFHAIGLLSWLVNVKFQYSIKCSIDEIEYRLRNQLCWMEYISFCIHRVCVTKCKPWSHTDTVKRLVASAKT